MLTVTDILLVCFGVGAIVTGVGVLIAAFKGSRSRAPLQDSFERARLKNDDQH